MQPGRYAGQNAPLLQRDESCRGELSMGYHLRRKAVKSFDFDDVSETPGPSPPGTGGETQSTHHSGADSFRVCMVHDLSHPSASGFGVRAHGEGGYEYADLERA